MRTLTLSVLQLLIISVMHAQDYQISFTGSGETTSIDSIQVRNLTQGTNLTLYGGDVLHLVGVVGIYASDKTEKMLKIFPNPMMESATIEFSNRKTAFVSIEIFDQKGVLVAKQSKRIQHGKQQFEISGLPVGIYTVNASADDWKFATKLISLGMNPRKTDISHKIVNEVSATENALKSITDLVEMQYNDGEMILIKGFGDSYARVHTLLPTQNQSVDFDFIPCSDVEGNNYAVVSIGDQTWMAENLKTTKYNDGTSLPLVTDSIAWLGLSSPAYCWYHNNQAEYGDIYGVLYNWYTVATDNLCPTGWHVPDKEEIIALVDYLGGQSASGKKLKSTGTIQAGTGLWEAPNYLASNETGFTAHPAGYRRFNASFRNLSEAAYFWSSTEMYSYSAWYLVLGYASSNGTTTSIEKKCGFSIRCLRD